MRCNGQNDAGTVSVLTSKKSGLELDSPATVRKPARPYIHGANTQTNW